MLPGFDAPLPNEARDRWPSGAAQETTGRRGERSGAVIDVAWWCEVLLSFKALVTGTILKGRTAPRPPESVGLVSSVSANVYVEFGAAHEHLFGGARPAVTVAHYLASELGLPTTAFGPIPDALPRLAWTRPPEARRRTAIVTASNESHRTALASAAPRLGLVVQTERILNVDVGWNCDAIGLWTGGTDGKRTMLSAGSLSHCQLAFPVAEMFRSLAFAVPWGLFFSDDQYSDLSPHLHAILSSELTVKESLQRICDAPFRVPADWCPFGAKGCDAPEPRPDWRFTFCGSWRPDMKAAFSLNGRDMKPTSGGAAGQSDPVTTATNAVMARMPLGLLDSDGFRRPTCAATPPRWAWGDGFGPDGSLQAGLVTRGLFAQNKFELLYWQPAMKLALSYPGVTIMASVAAALQRLSELLGASPTRADALQALRDAPAQAARLRPLLEAKTFPTKVRDGKVLTTAALNLGRTVGKAKPPVASGCSSAGLFKSDGGLVPLLEAELPTAPPDEDDGAALPPLQPLAKLLGCVAAKLNSHVAAIEGGLYAGKTHRWATPMAVAVALLAALALARRARKRAGWPSLAEVGFNAETRTLLERIGEVETTLSECVDSADVTIAPETDEVEAAAARAKATAAAESCMLAEFGKAAGDRTCRFSDANCAKPAGGGAPRPPRPDRTDCATPADQSGPEVATAPYTTADGELCKGRLVEATFPEYKEEGVTVPEEKIQYKVKDVAGDSEEGDPSLNLQGPRRHDFHWAAMSMLASGKGHVAETLALVPFKVMTKKQLEGLPVPVLRAELRSRKVPISADGKALAKAGLVASLDDCMVKVRAASPDAVAAAARETAAAAADAAAAVEHAREAAAAAAADAAAAVPSPRSWFGAGSPAQTAWQAADGFGGMRHENMFVGSSRPGAYILDTLHAVGLRFLGAVWARLLRLAGLIDKAARAAGQMATNVFASLKDELETAGLKLSQACGAWHIRQLHGNQGDMLARRLNKVAAAAALPTPQRGAILVVLELLPFFIEAHVHVLYPSRSYGASCSTLSAEVQETARILHVALASIFPSVLKKPEKPDSGWYGAFTPPSNYNAVHEAPRLFEQECPRAGVAALTAALFELAHVPPRRLYWATSTRGGQFGGRSVLMELQRNLVQQKVSKWRVFGNPRLFRGALHARVRHARCQVGYRANREMATAARRRWFECAGPHSMCDFHSVANDGEDNPDGFHADAGNIWLSLAGDTTLEHDDRPLGAERDDDLYTIPSEGGGETCGGDAGGGDAGGGVEGSASDMSDEEEGRQAQRPAPAPSPSHPAPTESEYEEALAANLGEAGEDESEFDLDEVDVPPDGEPLAPCNVPLE